MLAVCILIVAAALAWAWKKFLDKATGEELMGCGIFVFVPWLIIASAAIIALLAFT